MSREVMFHGWGGDTVRVRGDLRKGEAPAEITTLGLDYLRRKNGEARPSDSIELSITTPNGDGCIVGFEFLNRRNKEDSSRDVWMVGLVPLDYHTPIPTDQPGWQFRFGSGDCPDDPVPEGEIPTYSPYLVVTMPDNAEIKWVDRPDGYLGL